MKRGDIFWADLNPRSGSEQHGQRPVIIISHNGFNDTPTWRSIIVIPVSISQTQAKRGPSVVFLPKGSCGLREDSMALCHQVTTLDKSKLKHFAGSVSLELMAQIEAGLKAAVDLE